MGLFDGAATFLALLTGDSVTEDPGKEDYQLKSRGLDFSAIDALGAGRAGKPKPDSKPDSKGAGKPEKSTETKNSDPKSGPKGEAPASLKVEDRQALIERGASELLILLQREGRFVDFLEQDIDGFEDAEVGAASREIHKGCRKVLREHFGVAPVLEGVEEDDDVTVPAGFNPEEIRLVGKVKGKAPFKGVLRHHGWRAKKVQLPQVAPELDARVLAAAEVEL
jgi:hypothetical protein